MAPARWGRRWTRRCRRSERQEIADQSGYDAQAQKLTFAPYLRALLVRQIEGGSLHDLQDGMARDPLYQAHGAQLEISVPGLSKANAQRSPQPFWDVLAEVMAAVDALPQAVRIGRGKPLGAATPKQLRGDWPAVGADPHLCWDDRGVTAADRPVGADQYQAGAGGD